MIDSGEMKNHKKFDHQDWWELANFDQRLGGSLKLTSIVPSRHLSKDNG